MKLQVYSTIFILIVIGVSANCPPGFNYCAVENDKRCRITDTIREGYMSYGASGRYNLIPFTNTKTDGTDIEIECDNDHGDIISGTQKHCCYKQADTGFPDSGWIGYLNENGGGWRHFNDFESQRYGADNRYVIRVMTKSVGWCNNAFFNDPLFGTGKHCNYNHGEPSSLKNTGWTLCANEGYDCQGIPTSGYYWIRYGDNGSYYYRLVTTSDGKIPCTNNFFDDPIPGVGKYCWRSVNSVSVSDDVYMNEYEYKYIPSEVISSKRWYNFVSYIKNNVGLVFMIGVFVVLLFVVISWLLCNCQRKQRSKQYKPVTMIDESDIEKPINM